MAKRVWIVPKKKRRIRPTHVTTSRMLLARSCTRCGRSFNPERNPFETCYKCVRFASISRVLMKSSLYPEMLNACEKSGYTYKNVIPLWVYQCILKFQYAVLWMKILKELRKI